MQLSPVTAERAIIYAAAQQLQQTASGTESLFPGCAL